MQQEAEIRLEFVRKTRFGLVVDTLTAQLQLIRTLRGLTSDFSSFNDARFDENQFEQHLEADPRLAFATCWYWVRKLQGRFFAGDYASAIAAAAKAQALLWTSPSFFETAEYHFYAALARSALYGAASADERVQHLEALAVHRRKLDEWAKNCPDNFDSRAALVAAEIARIEKRELNAERLYEQAICSARANGFIHIEALANELASRFYAARGFEKIARVYLQDARYGYLRWGADGKVRQLEVMYPQLRTEEPAPGPMSTIATPVEHLDLATVIKVSQAISSEIVLEKLIETLMRTAIAQAGAERGLLILSDEAEPRIEAEAMTDGNTVLVELRDESMTAAVLPETVLHYVLRTRESVILDDAASQPSFAADPYIRQRQARSILCLPLINQAKLIGVLYLENNLTPRAFAPARIAVLKLLSSQAAITLENTRLYHELAGREAKIRRLVDANIIGIVIRNNEGSILEANDAFLRIVGYDREDLVAGRVRMTDLTTSESRDRTAQALAELENTGTHKPFEKEYFRKDGSRVPVLTGAAIFEGGSEGVAFVLDFTEQKRAEQALREREANIRRLFDANIIGIFTWDFEGRIFEANNAFLRMVGYDREHLASERLRWTELTPPEWRERDVSLVQEHQMKGRLPPFEKEFFRKDGSRVPVLIGIEIFEERRDQGVAFVLDLTERKRAEQALRRSEAYLAEGQRLTHTGSWAYNPFTGETTYWSDEMFRIFGLNPQESPSSEVFWRHVHPEDHHRVRERVEREAHEQREYADDYRIVLADGTVRHILDIGHPVFNAAGNLVEFVGTTVDVTERRRAE